MSSLLKAAFQLGYKQAFFGPNAEELAAQKAYDQAVAEHEGFQEDAKMVRDELWWQKPQTWWSPLFGDLGGTLSALGIFGGGAILGGAGSKLLTGSAKPGLKATLPGLLTVGATALWQHQNDKNHAAVEKARYYGNNDRRKR